MKRKAFRPKKRLGQHFLYDPAIANKIVDAADLSPDQLVVELGAGRGILTRPLVQRGVQLIAIEVDRDLHAELERSLDASGAEGGGRVELLRDDFTGLSITGMLVSRGVERCTLFGNIPYYLTREVLFNFLVDEHEMIDAAYLMLQREVGERIVSPPGNRVYGITSVVLQSLYSARILFRVAPGSFFTRPKVGSVGLEFKPLENPSVDAVELRPFMALVKNVFQQRRKTIHNTIKRFYSLTKSELMDIQEMANINLDKRPEELDKEQFVRLSRVVSQITMAEHE